MSQIHRRDFVKLATGVAVAFTPAYAGLDSRGAKYVGGTWQVPAETEGRLELSDETAARFVSRNGSVEIPYKSVTSIEYGQKAGRRVGVAVMVSPIALFSKKRKHYLTIGYTDAAGKTQGTVLELGKDVVRGTLTSLEARTGKQVEYESDDAKKNIGN